MYSDIAASIVTHKAILELDKFGQLIQAQPLSKQELATFFATMWAFFKDVPSGIVCLGAKITDELLDKYPWEASATAANVLFASVDEYGLQSQESMQKTHHQLFKELASHFNITDQDLYSEEHRLQAGTAMGDSTYRYYRSSKIGEAIGFHLASEMTSSREFQYFLSGFERFPEHYNLIHPNNSELLFFKIHCEVEPMHVATGRDVLIKCLDNDESIYQDAMRGAQAFMNSFGALFKALNQTLELSRE
ncbi:iron-containing redox enzyme family protein [Marinomonas agarivorans]|nr:iron-containing redox enzyme family protein [Marinomonas agarivorans]